jgi:hypothetical protein
MAWDAVTGRWVDSKSDPIVPVGYSDVLAPCPSLIPFHDSINPTRVGLSNTYLCQAISLPCNKYHPGLVLVPNYQTQPRVLSN